MEIKNPRRVLAIGAPDSGVLTLLKDLTGSAPSPLDSSTAGLTHNWDIKTSYYTTTLPIWIDEIPDLARWRDDFLTPEAREVVSAIGAWVYCFRKPLRTEDRDVVKDTLKGIQEVVEKGAGYSWDGVMLAVAMPQSIKSDTALDINADEWEDLCREYGFEYVDAEAKGRNEFGEVVGLERMKEAMESNEWEGAEGSTGMGLLDEEEEEEGDGNFHGSFAAEEAEMNMELWGMKNAIHGEGDQPQEQDEEDLQVEELERMMHKLQAVRDMGADLPESERRKLAAKAVNDIMKSF